MRSGSHTERDTIVHHACADTQDDAYPMKALTAIAITVAALVVALTVRSLLTRRVAPNRKTWLFSKDPADIALRSADNLRLLSEAQLREYERE